MLHPGLKVGEEPPAPPADFMQYRTSAVALQAQASQSALTVILSDIQDLWPRLSFQIVNLGGTLPFIFERMEAIARHRNPDAPFPTARLRNLWYDCASLGPRALELAVRVLGADRIFLGSDYPIFLDDPFARAVEPAAPLLLAIMVFGSGMWMSLSALLPPVTQAAQAAEAFFPLAFVEGSALLTSALGALLIVLSLGLVRRSLGALWLTVLALFVLAGVVN